MMKFVGVLGLAALLFCPGIMLPDEALGGNRLPEVFRFQGRVVRVELEGGFWGLVSSEGERYDPGGLPDEFHREGLEVQVTARRLEGVVSMRMWGQIIRILEIKAVSPPER